jgi:hypothetical protein
MLSFALFASFADKDLIDDLKGVCPAHQQTRECEMNNADATPHILQPAPDFSLVLGGPLYQLWRRAHLADDALRMTLRRIVAMAALAWLPLLLLSLAQDTLWGDNVKLTFLHDIELHIRLLFALPLLVVAELVVHQRMRPLVGHFLTSGLIAEDTRKPFLAAVEAALRLRNSIAAEVLLLILVYTVGVLYFWPSLIALDTVAWYGTFEDGAVKPSLAGWWMALVSLPLFQFILLRWYFRLFIWARFLWRVSRLELNIMPTHPDRCGGLGFLAGITQGFAPVLVAQGALLAGLMASRMLFAGAVLTDFKLEVFGLVAVMVFAVLGPLLVFAPRLAAAKRTGLREYGALAHHYASAFDRKWLRGGAPASEALVGSADIQSLADMSHSYNIIKEMRPVLFNLKTISQLALTTLIPATPLLLTIMPLEQLLDAVVKMLF